MLPYFQYDKINLGFLTVNVWGLFLGLAFAAAIIFAIREAKKRNISKKNILNLSFFVFVGAILGARLLFVLEFWNYFAANIFEIFKLSGGGFSFYGGLIGSFLSGWVYIRIRKLNFNIFADIVALSASLGIFVGRLGCFLIKDHPGAPTNLPWGVMWPNGIIRHPVALYLSLNGLLMFLILFFLSKKIKTSGYIFIIFLFWYNISRFLLDFTRIDSYTFSGPKFGSLLTSQWLALAIVFILCIIMIIVARKREGGE